LAELTGVQTIVSLPWLPQLDRDAVFAMATASSLAPLLTALGHGS
jgi:hypothetical protein